VVDVTDAVIYTNFGDHRLRVFRVAGSNFSLSYRLWSFPLQHSRTIVRVCDEYVHLSRLFVSHIMTTSLRPLLSVNWLSNLHITIPLLVSIQKHPRQSITPSYRYTVCWQQLGALLLRQFFCWQLQIVFLLTTSKARYCWVSRRWNWLLIARFSPCSWFSRS